MIIKQLIREVEQVTERLTEIKYNGIVSRRHEETGISCSRYCTSCSQGRGDCEYVSEMIKKLAEYEVAEKEGRLLILPCKPRDITYVILPSYTTCSKYGQIFEGYSCVGCYEDEEECDSHLEYCIWENKYTTQQWIIGNLERFGKTVFLNREEAERTLEEMNKDIGTNQRTNNYRTS